MVGKVFIFIGEVDVIAFVALFYTNIVLIARYFCFGSRRSVTK